MNIEVGKFYKTREGEKVRIYATDGHGGDTLHGAVYYDNRWLDQRWDKYGKCWQNIDRSKSDGASELDIVSEWVEPKKKVKLYAYVVNDSGRVYLQRREMSEKAGVTRLPNLDQEIKE